MAYLRVVAGVERHDDAAAGGRKNKKKNPKDAKQEAAYPFEDVVFHGVARAAGQPQRMTRAFAVPAGEPTTSIIGLRERPAQGAKPAADAPVKITVLKQELTMPELHGAELRPAR